MSDSVLVTYATRYGSTREVAEAVTTALRDTGLAADMQARAAGAYTRGLQRCCVGSATLYVSMAQGRTPIPVPAL
jgi:menaquinone-dependent protoporphyrinogen IX oxidase